MTIPSNPKNWLPQHARAARYLENLVAELRDLKILDMTRPLDLEHTYVRLRVQEKSRTYPRPEEEAELGHPKRDPDEWLRLRREGLEQQTQAAVAPEEALRRYRHCLVLGDPGAGKTTMLKHLALRSAQAQLDDLPSLPVFVSLLHFADSGFGSLLDFVAHDWGSRYGFPDARPYLEDRLESGDALLLLDGLDEVHAGQDETQAEASYRRVVDHINALLTRYRQLPIIVTSRLAGWPGWLAAGFHTLEVLDLGPQDIQRFVENWFHDVTDKATGLGRELARSSRMTTLAANPLLLSLIAIVYQQDLALPQRRADLYERCVHVLLTEWDEAQKKGLRRLHRFTPDHKRDLLEAVAWHFHQLGRRYFSQKELLAVIAAFLPRVGLPAEDNGRILGEVAAQHGLLKEQAIGWYGFLHLTLQEYFAARAAAHEQGGLNVVLANLHRPWWEEVTLLLAGVMDDAVPLLRRILGGPEDVFHSNLRLAGRCLAGRPQLSEPALRDDIQARLRECLKEARWPTEIELLARILAELGTENNGLLLALLADDKVDRNVRRRIAAALGALGERSVAPRLADLLADEKVNPDVRSRIAAALGELGERDVTPRLVDLLADEKVNSSVRWSIAATLGALGERSIASRLVDLLADERVDRRGQQSIAYALRKLGERSIAPRLVDPLADERVDRRVRQDIAYALGALGERSIAPRLVDLLADEKVDSDVRRSIAYALWALGERSIAPRLVDLLADEKVDSDVRRSIAYALGALGERSIAPRLVDLLADEKVDSDVRWRIAVALGELGERSVAPRLVDLLANEKVHEGVRREIAVTLRKLEERSIAPRLVGLLADEKVDLGVQLSIADRLGELVEQSVAPRLVDLLSGENVDPGVQHGIAYALGELGERSVAPRLVDLLAEEKVDWGVRRSIVDALGELGDTAEVARSLAALLRRTDDPDLSEWIYAALHRVSQRVGIRVLQDGYVIPLGPHTPPPAA